MNGKKNGEYHNGLPVRRLHDHEDVHGKYAVDSYNELSRGLQKKARKLRPKARKFLACYAREIRDTAGSERLTATGVYQKHFGGSYGVAAKNATRLMKEIEGFLEDVYQQTGLDMVTISGVISAAMRATKTEPVGGNEYREVPDHLVRLRAAALAAKLRGKDGSGKSAQAQQQNMVVVLPSIQKDYNPGGDGE